MHVQAMAKVVRVLDCTPPLPPHHTGEAGDLPAQGQHAELEQQLHDDVRVVLGMADQLDQAPRAAVQARDLLKVQALCVYAQLRACELLQPGRENGKAAISASPGEEVKSKQRQFSQFFGKTMWTIA
jgi:hypothetical protein